MNAHERSRFREVWIEAPGGLMLCALINGDVGWLMYLRAPGDAGFGSRNTDYVGPADATIEYYLNNGQRDEYPASWALPVEVVERALRYFRSEHSPPPFITWHNESGDGTSL